MGQQIDALREHAAGQGYEVVGEYADPGYSGSTLNRPNMDALRERVADGGIGVVLAQDADRITRDPMHRGILDDECAKHGTRLVALDDWGDDSHEGQLLKFIRGWQAKGERLKTAERTARNKRTKARAGMVVGGHVLAYGFDWKRDEDGRVVGYEVDEANMQTVRRIFAAVASGTGLRTIKGTLEDERVPTPGKSDSWNRTTIKKIVGSDLYKPHTIPELRQLGVSGGVLAGLDADGIYGLYTYQEIPVPVPASGVPLKVVEAARRNADNPITPSRNDGREWELSGGILRCAVCGRAMQTTTIKSGQTRHPYYRCQATLNGKNDRCPMRKHARADRIEAEVWESVRRTMDQRHYVIEKLAEYYGQKRRELSRPGADAGTLLARLDGIEKRWTKIKLAYEADALTVADLKSRRVEIDAEREAVERELERSKNRVEELAKLDADEAETRERLESGYGGLDGATPEKRRRVYRDLRLRVEVGADGKPRIFGVFPLLDADDVSRSYLWKAGDHGYLVRQPVSRSEASLKRGGR